MDPTIQLIQLMLRVEREAEAQCRPYMADRDDLADENRFACWRTRETILSNASSICFDTSNLVKVYNRKGSSFAFLPPPTFPSSLRQLNQTGPNRRQNGLGAIGLL